LWDIFPILQRGPVFFSPFSQVLWEQLLLQFLAWKGAAVADKLGRAEVGAMCSRLEQTMKTCAADMSEIN